MKTVLRAAALLSSLAAAPALAQALPPPTPEKVTLDQAVERALGRNPTALIAVQQVKQVYAQMEEVRAQSLPTLGLNGIYTRIDHDRIVEGQVALAANQLTANAALSVPLIAPKSWAAWSRAVDAIDVQKMNTWDVKRLLGVSAARAYLTVQTQKRVVDIDARARDTAKAHLDFAQKRLEGGVGNRIDAVRAAQELATDESNYQTGLSGLTRDEEALGVLLGVDGPMDVVDTPLQLPVPLTEKDAVDDAGKDRTDVLLSRERLRQADRSLHLTWTDYMPSIVGLGEYIYTNPPTLEQPTWGWEVQLALVIPLYDGGLRYGLTHEREAIRAIARLGVESAVRQAQSDARAAYGALVNADAALASARNAANLADQALKLADLAYRAGATTDIEVIDAQRVARDAETQAALADDSNLQARLDLLNAAGLFPKKEVVQRN